MALDQSYEARYARAGIVIKAIWIFLFMLFDLICTLLFLLGG